MSEGRLLILTHGFLAPRAARMWSRASSGDLAVSAGPSARVRKVRSEGLNCVDKLVLGRGQTRRAGYETQLRDGGSLIEAGVIADVPGPRAPGDGWPLYVHRAGPQTGHRPRSGRDGGKYATLI